jgi:hypothetical protein
VALQVANATAGIALRIIWPRKPSHPALAFDKVEIPWRGTNPYICFDKNTVIIRGLSPPCAPFNNPLMKTVFLLKPMYRFMQFLIQTVFFLSGGATAQIGPRPPPFGGFYITLS